MKKLIIKLIQRFILKDDSGIKVGDLVLRKGINSDLAFEAVGIYYSYELQPFVFVRDSVDGKIIGLPMSECRSPYTKRK